MPLFKAGNKLHALKFPFAALSFALGQKSSLHEALILHCARRLLKERFNRQDWMQSLDEIELNQLIPQQKNNNSIRVGNSINTTFGKWIYCCIRALKPEIMIETGVAHGSSTWIILNALHKNGKGKLISVDLPNKDPNASYNFNGCLPETGWLVPEELKARWELHLGDAKVILPQLLKIYPSIDIFFHDSDHSYDHMKWEFETIFPHLKRNGIVLSDDVHENNAFPEFIDKNKLEGISFNKGGCAVMN